jgi:flagellin-like hook-associated protein FlgL
VGGDLAIGAAANDWVADTDIDAAVADLDDALTELRSQAKTLSSNLSVVTTRQEFTTDMISTLTEGADQLTAADLNEEGANMLALQTRQQLGIQALSLASQAQQSILRLF